MITVSDAPSKARNLTKKCGFLRQSLSQISKSEQAGVQGATVERQKVSAQFAKEAKNVETAIQKTTKIAADFAAAALILRSGSTSTDKTSPLATAAARVARLGLSDNASAALEAKLAAAAVHATAAAEKSADRMADAHDDLTSVGLLAEISAKLPGLNFNIQHPSIKAIRSKYLSYCRSQKAQRITR